MEEEPGGARKGGNNSLQRWQIAAAAVAGILGVTLCIISRSPPAAELLSSCALDWMRLKEYNINNCPLDNL